MTIKTCSACKNIKPLSEFEKRRDGKDGRRGQCTICRREKKHEHYLRNREQICARSKRWYAENQEKAKAYRAQHYQANRESYIERAAQCVLENPEKRRAYIQHWNVNNADKMRAYRKKWAAAHPENRRIRDQRRRARKTKAFDDLTESDWDAILERYDQRCLCCGTTKDITLDHIIPLARSGPTTKSNIQPLCGKCNSTKGIRIIDYRPEWWANAT